MQRSAKIGHETLTRKEKKNQKLIAMLKNQIKQEPSMQK